MLSCCLVCKLIPLAFEEGHCWVPARDLSGDDSQCGRQDSSRCGITGYTYSSSGTCIHNCSSISASNKKGPKKCRRGGSTSLRKEIRPGLQCKRPWSAD